MHIFVMSDIGLFHYIYGTEDTEKLKAEERTFPATLAILLISFLTQKEENKYPFKLIGTKENTTLFSQ